MILPNTRQFLAVRKLGVVYRIDPERVLKEFYDGNGGEIKRRVYQRLGLYPNIAKVLDIRTDSSIILERGIPFRIIYRASSANKIPILIKVLWLRHAAEGY